ncbi:serine/threonine protein kinase HT1, putative [Entamoeba invadens IP1]|uniref:Serine/threonine protein kinase HT1, putative n=1 Tax=Entamoeba invadens IP1 TaxID=370355 RepID=L7FKJ6_ENTIV|nr:serine/threonine protein kinase HT1, putative [Entamoeba invadens IP1]ELP86393.1 serine/threonine protein kinase HT1, putative [Entamoeba invadens IP1]|eukprot:XP_004185739.1 serine/threonine protein kinase HT1, putative [Entamoeba invadens IP1]
MLDKFSVSISSISMGLCLSHKSVYGHEYAPFGSLQNLIDTKKSDEFGLKLRVKMCLDAIKGIVYLHTNGILHRDIKPDNILVFSLDLSCTDVINAKLTDFGSARNVNLLMTNMTFTKGIGTPKYMAPEILQKQKYKESADVYSFAMTMYEIFIWGEAFPREMFRYPWEVVNFITGGRRLDKPANMDNALFKIVSDSWRNNSNERNDACKIEKSLGEYYLSLN